MHPAKISVLRLVRKTCCALQRVDRYDVPDPTAIEEGFEQWAPLSQAHMRGKRHRHTTSVWMEGVGYATSPWMCNFDCCDERMCL
jgi:hypothetical protein